MNSLSPLDSSFSYPDGGHPLKILVISDYRDSISAKTEAAFLIGAKKLGVEIEVMTHPGCELTADLRAAGIHVIEFHPNHKWDRKESDRIRETLVTGQHDLIHLFNSKAICTGLRAAKGLPVSVVVYRGYVGNLNWWNPGDYLKFLHPRVDGIHCASHATAEHIRRQCVFVHPMLRAIHKGHDIRWYDAVPPLGRDALGIPDGAFLLVTVANTRRMKGIPYLIRAMRLMPPELPVHLVLVGRGLESPSVHKLMENTPCQKHVHFTGFRDDAWSIVKTADAFVLPSIFGEAITKAAIEAMALGVPLILTDIPGNRDLAVHEQSGLIVPRKNPEAIRDAILRFFRDAVLRSRCAEGARERVRTTFNTNDTAVELVRFYEDVLSASRA